MTLIVNLFGGPGISKSTTAAFTFAKLKQYGVNCELANEFAKDLTWEKRHKTLTFQPYVAGKQIWRVHRLIDQVDVIVTDSPILLSTVYKGDGYTEAFEDYILDTYRRWNTYSVMLRRNSHRAYNERGRSQSRSEAEALDDRIQAMVVEFDIPHTYYQASLNSDSTAKAITNDVLKLL